MPIYEGIGSDKNSVVLEIGSAFTKCGFASELSPRAILPSQIYLPTFDKKLVDVLFLHLDVQSLLLVPNHVMVLATLGINTGLVLDVGYKEATAIPIVESVTLLDLVKFAPLGSKSIHYRINDELIQRNAIILENGQESPVGDSLSETILEDIKIKTCFVTTIERGSHLVYQKLSDEAKSQKQPPVECSITRPPPAVRFPVEGNKLLKIPGSLPVPVDCRRQLASNIVLVGGTVMLPGFKHRLFQEIKHLTTNSERYKQLSFAGDFKFHKLPCKENYGNWLGASIFATSDLLLMRSITSEQYKASQRVTDWSSCWNPGL
ncbi:Actin- protein 10 [Tyrophagus putrescentiae]|nr:Actin- protein 10 [Tyrophagus putrescentiae]